MLNMTFEEAKAHANELYAKLNECSAALNKYPKGDMGMVAESIRMTPEYKTETAAFRKVFEELRQFNTVYVKQFKKELREERAKKYAQTP